MANLSYSTTLFVYRETKTSYLCGLGESGKFIVSKVNVKVVLRLCRGNEALGAPRDELRTLVYSLTFH